MKKILKRILKGIIIIITEWINISYSLAKVIVYSSFSPSISSIHQKQKECYILANGPSLSEDIIINHAIVSEHSIIVLNDFIISSYFEELKPSIYILADDAYFSENSYYIEKHNTTSIFNHFCSKVKWDMQLFIPNYAFKTNFVQNELASNSHIKIEFYNTTSVFFNFRKLRYWLYDKNLATPHIQNVLVGSIYIAMRLGFKEINLLGADHSWTKNLVVNSNNEVCLTDFHFYDEIDTPSIPWVKLNNEVYKMHEILKTLSLMFQGYWDLKEYAEYLNVSIINHTKLSFIDAFKRKHRNI